MDTPACITEHCTRLLRQPELDAGQWICLPCIRTMRSWLAELPAQLIVLRASTQRESAGSPVRSGTRTPPLPGREDVLNLLGPSAAGNVHDPYGDQCGPLPIAATLGAWVRLIGEELRIDPPLPATEEGLASWLAQRLTWAAGQLWVGELHAELKSLIRMVRNSTRVRPGTRPVSRPCPRCQCLTLSRRDHDLYIRCGNQACEAIFLESELNEDAPRQLDALSEECSAA